MPGISWKVPRCSSFCHRRGLVFGSSGSPGAVQAENVRLGGSGGSGGSGAKAESFATSLFADFSQSSEGANTSPKGALCFTKSL